jgi:uncharacterized YccA/Bax inhibitor family protein
MALSNPALNVDAFRGTWAEARTPANVMTVPGTAIKTVGLLAIAFVCAAWSWGQVGQGAVNGTLLMVSLIGGGIVGFVTVMNPRWSPITAPIYAALEGLFLGAFSNLLETQLQIRVKGAPHGIVYEAVALTSGVLLLMLFLYATRLIRVTGRLTAGIMAATGAIALLYLVQIVMSFFHTGIPHIFGSGPIGIGFSFLVVGIAAFNLLINFDVIERGAAGGAPRYMEWYGAFGLMVTLVWLYIEILDLLAKLQRRND